MVIKGVIFRSKEIDLPEPTNPGTFHTQSLPDCSADKRVSWSGPLLVMLQFNNSNTAFNMVAKNY